MHENESRTITAPTYPGHDDAVHRVQFLELLEDETGIVFDCPTLSYPHTYI